MFSRSCFLFYFLCVVFGASCHTASPTAAGASDLRGQVRKVVLDNGMTFLLLSREGAPVFSINLNVKVGSLEDPKGHSGLAHFFEHMAFKGTDKMGARDFAREKPILDQVLDVGTKVVELRKSGANSETLAAMEQRLHELQDLEDTLIAKNEFSNIMIRNGAADLNAMTGADMTTYIASLPVNKMEMWAYWESQRIANRVLREFFTERDVVAEERRMSVDNSPMGRLYEGFLNAGFNKSPYKIMTIGKPEEIQWLTPDVARAFYSKYYVPSRMVGALVGHFDLDEAERIVRKYFSIIPKGEDVVETFASDEKDFAGPREITVRGGDLPRFLLGYHRPAWPHPDDAALEMLSDILCGGSTSRLVKKIVYEANLATDVDCSTTFPGDRLDSLFMISAAPTPGHNSREIVQAVRAELVRLGEEGPTPTELTVAKNREQAAFVYALVDNSNVADSLTFYQSLTGDWANMYHERDLFERVTAEDVKRVVKNIFVPRREVAGYLEPE